MQTLHIRLRAPVAVAGLAVDGRELVAQLLQASASVRDNHDGIASATSHAMHVKMCTRPRRACR